VYQELHDPTHIGIALCTAQTSQEVKQLRKFEAAILNGQSRRSARATFFISS